ncbi:MAG: hypothetical protein CW342_02740 [Thermoactinomycetaceae bacterium]|nr:hypothetical protein [Thermoactinomycetaceae bacterium]
MRAESPAVFSAGQIRLSCVNRNKVPVHRGASLQSSAGKGCGAPFWFCGGCFRDPGSGAEGGHGLADGRKQKKRRPLGTAAQ